MFRRSRQNYHYFRAQTPKKSRLRRLSGLWHHHTVAIPLLTFGGLALLTGLVFAGLMLAHRGEPHKIGTRIVILSYDHQEQTVPTNERTVGELVKKLAIPLNPGDVVEPSSDSEINQDDFRVNIYRAVPVKVVDNNNTVKYGYSAATTPRSIAAQTGVKVYAEDRLATQPVDNFLRDYNIGETVVIDRSFPISLTLYGTPIATRTHANTVAELLKEKHIKLGADDQIQPSLETTITPGIQVYILRKGTQIDTKTEEIPMPIQVINDPNLSYGSSAIRQRGSPGKQIVTYQINLQNGVEVGRSPIQTVVIRPAVLQIVVKGTAPVSGSLQQWLYKLRMCETHDNYQANTGNGYYGAYQFLISTWDRIAPRAGRSDLVGVRPDLAAPADQDLMIIVNTKLSSGGLATQNPGCYSKTGISAYPPPS
jgi:uncharacterized protein YabE (DUF348 family)